MEQHLIKGGENHCPIFLENIFLKFILGKKKTSFPVVLDISIFVAWSFDDFGVICFAQR